MLVLIKTLLKNNWKMIKVSLSTDEKAFKLNLIRL